MCNEFIGRIEFSSLMVLKQKYRDVGHALMGNMREYGGRSTCMYNILTVGKKLICRPGICRSYPGSLQTVNRLVVLGFEFLPTYPLRNIAKSFLSLPLLIGLRRILVFQDDPL